MVQLFLTKPSLEDKGEDTDAAEELLSRLKQLESSIRLLIASGNRSEARLWLCNTVSSISSITPHDQCKLFIGLLKSKPPKRSIAAQLWQMVIEKRPQKAGSIIAKRSYILEKFFEGNPQRILQWFGNFASSGESEHRKGAKALTQFAFVNRDICWDELEWKGKHGQSPAIVATKPHYFLDLDVVRTVENFLENVPEFWSSDELADSLKGGEMFLVDPKFFMDYFVRMMYEDNVEDVWSVINEFLIEEQFSYLCQHLLILLDECDLHNFLKTLCKVMPSRLSNKSGFGLPSFWLEILLSESDSCPSIDELLIINAVITHRRQLIRLVSDEEHEVIKENIEKLVLNDYYAQTDVSNCTFMRKCLNMNKGIAIKWFAFQAWLVHFILMKKCSTEKSWESLFHGNGINFQKCNNFTLVNNCKLSEVIDSDLEKGLPSKASKKNRRKKKRKKHYDEHEIIDDDELLELETSNGGQSLRGGSISWFLSTDKYSCSWNSVDLPEYLAGYCFSIWLTWLCS